MGTSLEMSTGGLQILHFLAHAICIQCMLLSRKNAYTTRESRLTQNRRSRVLEAEHGRCEDFSGVGGFERMALRYAVPSPAYNRAYCEDDKGVSHNAPPNETSTQILLHGNT